MKKKYLFLSLVVLLAAILATLLPAVSSSAMNISFNDPGFSNTWNRIDKPVDEIPGVGRGFTWGPIVLGAAAITNEPYGGATRKVQYFDKARMEVNNPSANPSDLFYVTTGLLVKELVTGKQQISDTDFTQFTPSTVQVAGDPNDGGQNSVAPTYASFKNVVTFNGSENGKDRANGGLINTQIDKAGNVGTYTPPEQRTYSGYDDTTRHNIADVFVNFGNRNGKIWNGSAFVDGAVFFGNSVYVTGRPVSEAYWVQAVVGGVTKPVLVQLFERRVLTYTPGNAAGFEVEMGNVGQHYYKWRYVLGGGGGTPTPTPTPTATPTPAPQPFPQDFSQFRAPYHKTGAKPVGGSPGGIANFRGYSVGAAGISASSPVVNSDQSIAVYATNNKGVVALNLTASLNDLTQKWIYPASGTVPPISFATPILYNGVVYIGDDNGNMHAIKLADGTSVWTTPSNAGASFGAVVGAAITDGTNLYFNTASGRLLAIRLSDGVQVWQSVPLGVLASGPIFAYGGNLFVGSTNGKVYAFQTSNGSEVATWTKPALNPIILTMAYANNTLYVPNGATLTALNSSGTTIKDVTLDGTISSVPAVTADKVYFGVDTANKVYGINASNLGDVNRFVFGASGNPAGAIALVDGFIYFGTSNGILYQVEAANSANANQLVNGLSGFGNNSPVVANGRVYIGNSDGKLYIVK
ncbi:MAG: PQQ-binding-like beta-propeller repeat protein [Chloroflexi bacterium]|uniref:PQQ-binding-like beta-propeller repeat protein n=1 Tax=Candidatus Chlorohelix allophototropha TaxID=3003348 RepID=A0A8T7M3J2_9CHLR|nr:PQQ-binding-like beta-propeller repeat protein [Chloroflexota bacterium]WJW67915.1 PQQ-binding-like beta-propeller repeat protein [Chloroflexota bacterium L227-S17]